MQSFQESSYQEDYDYRDGSPHLKHWSIYDRVIKTLRGLLKDLDDAGIESSLLDIGAGEGSFIEPILASGHNVTAVEMSRPSINRLKSKYGRNKLMNVHFDADGSLSALGEQQFGVILYASVLHHIPDYMAAIDNAITNHLLPGGCLITVQDPMWYPTQSRLTRLFDDFAYMVPRIFAGHLLRGFQARMRRMSGKLDETNPWDMVEYHVVRNGVNQHEIEAFLSTRFSRVEVTPYWSAQSAFWQKVGEKSPFTTTFMVVASGYNEISTASPRG